MCRCNNGIFRLHGKVNERKELHVELLKVITKVTQNNTGMYTKGSSQKTFEIPNNNLDVKFEKAHQNHNNEILQTRKRTR